MSGGRLIVWLRFCRAVIGVPAAIRPMTGIEIIERSRSSSEVLCAKVRTRPSVIEGTLGRVRTLAQSTSDDDLDRSMISIPVMGRIAAGTPIAALQNRSHTISLPPDMLPPGDYYALEVRGDSMIEAGIFDSDTVVIRKQDTAETGDIVVALIDDEEATLKRLRKRGASIALEAANPAYET